MTRDTGSLSAELVLLTPLLVLLMLFVVFSGRLGQATSDVRQATAQAARAASLRAGPAAAVSAARQEVDDNLSASGVDCATVDVDVDTAALQPGGTIAVTVSCSVALNDLAFPGIPGTRVLTAEAVEVIDTYRGGG